MFDIDWLAGSSYLAAGAGLILVLVITNLLVLWRLRHVSKLVRVYEKLFKEHSETRLEDILGQMSKQEKENRKDIESLRDRIQLIEKRLPGFITRMAVMRYKGFPDVGGDLSFSLALLSDEGDGVVLTGLHGREESRVWAKPVQRYSSSYQLSGEEQEVLRKARDRQ